jgi:Domain of unknown function (DUF6471)
VRRSAQSDPESEWQARARGMLRAELVKRNINYVDLADRLRAMGVTQTQKNLSNKIARGAFSASFLLQCLSAIGCRVIRLDDE